MPAKGTVRSKSLHNKSVKSSTGDPHLTVKDCLYWPTATISAATKIKTKRARSTSRYPNKSKANASNVNQNSKQTEDKKSSDSKLDQKQENSDKPAYETNGLAIKLESFYLGEDDDPIVCYSEVHKKKDGKMKNKKNDSGAEAEPCLGDLLSYRYFREAQEQKKLSDKMKKLAKKDAIKASKERRNDLKSTKTSQLRSIAVSSDYDGISKEVPWKMTKFANVQSKISTGLLRDNAEVTSERASSKEGKFSYDYANDTSRFKESDGHIGFSPPGGLASASQGLSTDLSPSNNFSYEYLPSTNHHF